MHKIFLWAMVLAVLGAGVYMWDQSRPKAPEPELAQTAPNTPNLFGSSTPTGNPESGAPQNSLNPQLQVPNTNTKQIMNVTLHTNKGDIVIQFLPDQAPKTVENFIKLAEAKFYDGTKFHRVIKDFMIQGGDPLSKDDAHPELWGTGGPGYKIPDELGPQNKNNTGTISMANSGPNTGGSQFFINTHDNSFLDTKHTVFGQVVKGMDVVRAIESTPTSTGDRPVDPIIISSVTVE